jgi:hypothetical protein
MTMNVCSVKRGVARAGAAAAAVALPLVGLATAVHAETVPPPAEHRYVLPFEVLHGQPDMGAGDGVGYWLWKDDKGLHLRTTTRGQEHVFSGTIRTAPESSFEHVTEVRFEDTAQNHDRMVQADDDLIRFRFHTWDGTDGVDFQLDGPGFCVQLADAGAEATNRTHLGGGQVKPNALPVCFRR